MNMSDIRLPHGRFLKSIQIVMIEESDRRDSHGRSVPEGPVLKNDSRYLLPFQTSAEREDSIDRSNGISTRKITKEAELFCNIFGIDFTALNEGFSQGEGHVRIIGVTSCKRF